MSIERPVSCTGRAGAPCSGCLRFTTQAKPFEALALPEVLDGKCGDYLPGRRPVAPRETTAGAA